MSAEIVQANYETLEQVGQRFGHQADSIEQMIGQVAANVDALQNGGWIGEAATQFQVEMTEDIFPATRRLQDALQQSQTTVQQIIQIIKTAEEEAAQPFSNGGGGDSGGSPAGTRTIPDVISPAPGTFDGRRAKYDIGKPVDVSDHDFHSGKGDAVKYEVEINGRKIPVFMPKNPSGSTHSIDEVAKGLAALPEASLALVKRVDVEPNKNPDDAYWAKEYNDPNFESYMTAGGDGVVNIYPVPQSQDYLDGTMIHETGHILSNTMWGSDTSGKGWDDWKAAAAADKNIPSEYAKSSPAEDFSETLQLYYQVKGTPQEKVERALYLERFKMIDKILADKGSSP